MLSIPSKFKCPLFFRRKLNVYGGWIIIDGDRPTELIYFKSTLMFFFMSPPLSGWDI